MFTNPKIWLIVLVGGFIFWGLWYATRTQWTIRIVVDPDGVRSCRGLPKARESHVIEFLKQDIACDARYSISAKWQGDGYLRMKIDGPLDAGAKQRIRNFLLSEL